MGRGAGWGALAVHDTAVVDVLPDSRAFDPLT